MKKILYIDMDGVLVDFRSGEARMTDYERRTYPEDKHDEVPGIFGRMDPMPGAIGAFHQLAPLFDTHVLSTAAWANPSAWSDKLLWVQRHLGDDARKRLILTHHKDLVRGDYLVDDLYRPDRGANRFQGELIAFGSAEFPDWEAVVSYLKAAAE